MFQVDIPEQIEVGSADITGMQMLQVIWSQVACWKRKLKILKRYELQTILRLINFIYCRDSFFFTFRAPEKIN